MCGRFVSSRPLAELAERFLVEEVHAEALPANYNVAPTDPVYAVAEHDSKRLLGTFRWGLVPPGGQGPRPINARAETLVERPLFRESFARCRCLLPADGFDEWGRLVAVQPSLALVAAHRLVNSIGGPHVIGQRKAHQERGANGDAPYPLAAAGTALGGVGGITPGLVPRPLLLVHLLVEFLVHDADLLRSSKHGSGEVRPRAPLRRVFRRLVVKRVRKRGRARAAMGA